VAYVVGGSVASSVHGLPRSTADSDIVAALREEHAVHALPSQVQVSVKTPSPPLSPIPPKRRMDTLS
jgi:hypothetical protein